MTKEQLAREAARAASEVRRRLQVDRAAPICPFDVAERSGIQVRLMAIPSAEGIYCSDRGPAIIISTERPPGRQNFTCAHEFGHHEFGHGTRSDEYLESLDSRKIFAPEEYLADVFAGHLLMPAAAVRDGFSRRGVTASTATEPDVFAVAGWLGVGFETLVTHLHVGLQMISTSRANELRRRTPKQIREQLWGPNPPPQLLIAGAAWSGRPIDLRVGEGVFLPRNTRAEGGTLEFRAVDGEQVCAVAIKPGLGRLEASSPAWNCFVRVMRQDYEGLSRFRFDEDCDDEYGIASDH